MQSVEHPHLIGDILVDHPRWRVHEMQFNREKLKWLWNQSKQYSTLYTDLTRGDEQSFVNLVTSPDTYWMEVMDQANDEIIGLLYLTEIDPAVDCKIHSMFFDRRPAEKVDLCRDALKHVADKFYFHRMTAAIPSIYHATRRLVEKLGFVQEGERQEVYLMGGKWVNELVFGLLTSEIKQ